MFASDTAPTSLQAPGCDVTECDLIRRPAISQAITDAGKLSGQRRNGRMRQAWNYYSEVKILVQLLDGLVITYCIEEYGTKVADPAVLLRLL